MSSPDQALLHELGAVERLQILSGDSEASTALRREYLLRHAAAADRCAQTLHDGASRDQAVEAALRLLAFDRAEGTGRGRPASDDPRWEGVPRAYVHQEHAIAALEGRLTTAIDEWMLAVDLAWDDAGWIDTDVDGLQVRALPSSDIAAEALGGWVGIRTREGTRATLLMTVLDVAAGRGTDTSAFPITPPLARSIATALGARDA
ncbi:hypothetical protein ACH4PU_30735 [Streptomyces sp. NPDC021100]|uniref:hypothetical protein n=1 Tax=Streptomyces sp. NPDC021100 TaxID=3365114 RepID=UPI003795F398